MAELKMISNTQLWNMLRQEYPNFADHTSKVTNDILKENGLEATDYAGSQVLDEFFELSMRVILNLVNISNAKDIFDTYDVGENFTNAWGGVLQRMAVHSIKPISPAFAGKGSHANGSSIDPFVIKKPTVDERFFKQNFEYQSLVSLIEPDLRRQIFNSEYGVYEFVAGIMKGLENGYTLQKYTNKLECIHTALSSTKHPLQETQKVSVHLSDTPTADELKQLYYSIYVTIQAMTSAPQTSAFNAGYFESTQDVSRLRLLIRQGIPAQMRFSVLASAFNRADLGLQEGVQIMEVPNFGGLEPYKEDSYDTLLYPVYDKLGTLIGYNEEENQENVTVEEVDVKWKDPHANTVAVLMDKGTIFTSMQSGYSVQSVYNPRGMYTNFFANAPRTTIAYDHYYNLVEFENTPS